jgi:hypothetical protein
LPKIGPWRDEVDGLLLANEGKALRERLTVIRVFEALRGSGYDGSHDAVRRRSHRRFPTGRVNPLDAPTLWSGRWPPTKGRTEQTIDVLHKPDK